MNIQGKNHQLYILYSSGNKLYSTSTFKHAIFTMSGLERL